MKVEGDFTFDGPREVVWEILLDPAVLAKALPGTETLERTGEGEYRGTMKIGVGPVTAGRYDVVVTIVDAVPPESYGMRIDGRGALGFARGTARIALSEDGPERTRMRYDADLQIGGKVAAVGQRLIDNVARGLTQKGLEALDRELARRLAEGGSGGAGTGGTEGSPA